MMTTNPPILPGMLRNDTEDSIHAHRFAHKAMATIFEIVCVHEDQGYAGQAARAAFDLIDRVETELMDPRTGLPVRNRPAAWVSGSLESLNAVYQGKKSTMPSGVFETGDSPSAVAEALSTGFMIMSCDEIADCCLRHPGVEGRILISDPYDASVSPVLQRFAHDHQ